MEKQDTYTDTGHGHGRKDLVQNGCMEKLDTDTDTGYGHGHELFLHIDYFVRMRVQATW